MVAYSCGTDGVRHKSRSCCFSTIIAMAQYTRQRCGNCELIADSAAVTGARESGRGGRSIICLPLGGLACGGGGWG